MAQCKAMLLQHKVGPGSFTRTLANAFNIHIAFVDCSSVVSNHRSDGCGKVGLRMDVGRLVVVFLIVTQYLPL